MFGEGHGRENTKINHFHRKKTQIFPLKILVKNSQISRLFEGSSTESATKPGFGAQDPPKNPQKVMKNSSNFELEKQNFE